MHHMKLHRHVVPARDHRQRKPLSRLFWATLAASLAAATVVLVWHAAPAVDGWVWFK
jgi:hypothetical protein